MHRSAIIKFVDKMFITGIQDKRLKRNFYSRSILFISLHINIDSLIKPENTIMKNNQVLNETDFRALHSKLIHNNAKEFKKFLQLSNKCE